MWTECPSRPDSKSRPHTASFGSATPLFRVITFPGPVSRFKLVPHFNHHLWQVSYEVSNIFYSVVTRRADLSLISLYISASSRPKTLVPSPNIYTWLHPQCLLSRSQMQEGALHSDEKGCVLKVSEVRNNPRVPLGQS